MSKPDISYVPEGSLKLRWKTLIIGLILLAFAEGWLLKHTLNTEKQVTPEPYVFVDDEKNNILSVKGSWTSDKMMYPIQASAINCYKSLGYCDEALSEISGSSLIVFNDLVTITTWTKDIVETSEKYPCAQTIMRLDRQAKIVTKTQSSRNGKGCPSELSGPATVYQLVDGFKVWLKANGNPSQ